MIEQGSEEWLQQRCGMITASRLGDMLAGGAGLTRDKYKCELAIQRMTGNVIEGFKSFAMQKGNDLEPLAREHYEFFNDVDVILEGFCLHPTIKNSGASPDGLVGDDGLIEIKCPELHTHIKYKITEEIPKNYMLQIQWNLAVFNRQWCDFMSYNPDMPQHLKAWIKRVFRDEKTIEMLSNEIRKFDNEIEILIRKLG